MGLVVFRRVSNFATVISVFTDILLAIFLITCHDQLLIYFLEYSCNKIHFHAYVIFRLKIMCRKR